MNSSAEEKFREKLVKYLDAHFKVKKMKGDAQKLVDSIQSKHLHDMAEDFLKTNKEYKNQTGGKKSRKKRKKKKNKSRRVQRGGQWEMFTIFVVISVGAAILGTRIYSRTRAMGRFLQEFPSHGITSEQQRQVWFGVPHGTYDSPTAEEPEPEPEYADLPSHQWNPERDSFVEGAIAVGRQLLEQDRINNPRLHGQSRDTGRNSKKKN